MLHLRYLGSGTTYLVNFQKVSDHVIRITGEFPVKTTGFFLSRIGAYDSWDYSKFTTIYREVDEGVEYSDNGTVYPETSGECVPTLREEVNVLKEEVAVLKEDVQSVNTVLEG